MNNSPPDDFGEPDAPSLFGPAEDWHFNACMPGNHYWEKWSTYVRGYKLAADLLVKLILEGRSEAVMDTLVMPVVFNYRQYIELSLKLLIIKLDVINHAPYKIPATHNLETLWQKAKNGLKIVNVTEPPESFESIARILSEFMQYDPGSFSFRYPVSKDGALVLENLRHINVRRLCDAIQELDDAFQPIAYQVGYHFEASSERE